MFNLEFCIYLLQEQTSGEHQHIYSVAGNTAMEQGAGSEAFIEYKL